LFRWRLRLLHAMLDVILIVCLVVFALAWPISNNWDCLMSLWKKSHVVFWDFYFRALRSLVVLSFPQPLNFSSVFPSL
jgi:hypothetical protein